MRELTSLPVAVLPLIKYCELLLLELSVRRIVRLDLPFVPLSSISI